MTQSQGTAIRWLRISFLAGAAADAVLGVMILIPARMGEADYRYPMGLAASLMFGWACLMLWGYLKPLERRFLLILTIFPVITGLTASSAYQYVSGAFSLARALPNVILGVGLIVLFGLSYHKARSLDRP